MTEPDAKRPKRPKRPGESGSRVRPVPPRIVQNILWLLRHGRRYKFILILAVLVIAAGWLIPKWPLGALFTKKVAENALDAQFKRVAGELRSHFQRARDALERSGSADFSEVSEDIATLLKLDPRNGHALYYSGELKRIRDTAKFTAKSCPNTPLVENSLLEPYRRDFYKYLETSVTLSPAEAGGDLTAQTCYDRPKGYCPQRTAWVHHLIANDLHAEAMASTNAAAKSEKLKIAADHARMAIKLYPRTATKSGFEQCIPSNAIISTVDEALKVPR